MFAPEKSHEEVKRDLKIVKDRIQQYKEEKAIIKSTPKFVPAGQSTQMVVGASPETDKDILLTADAYYKNFQLKRVYYSGYIPISNDTRLPVIGSQPPLIRENRLYQTDWLMRFYKFDVNEIVNQKHPNLDLDIDPKLSWALRNPDFFPIDINTADYAMILRIPGVGVKSAKKIIQARKFGKLRIDQVKKMGIAFHRAQYFMICADSSYSLLNYSPSTIKNKILTEGHSKFKKHSAQQLTLF